MTQKILLEKKWWIEGFWMAAIVFFANIVGFLISKEDIETNKLIKLAVFCLLSGILWGYVSRWRASRIHKKKQEE